MYQKEIQRRAHSFYMRKQVKVAGRNLEDIKKSIAKLKMRAKDRGGAEKLLESSQQINLKEAISQNKNKVIY